MCRVCCLMDSSDAPAPPGLESQEFAEDADQDEKGLSNSMGLFLQKTNIIRDYLEARAQQFGRSALFSGVFPLTLPHARAGHHGGACPAHVLAQGGVEQVRAACRRRTLQLRSG